jgi:hypothetical protein
MEAKSCLGACRDSTESATQVLSQSLQGLRSCTSAPPCGPAPIRTGLLVGTVGYFSYYHLELIGENVIFFRGNPFAIRSPGSFTPYPGCPSLVLWSKTEGGLFQSIRTANPNRPRQTCSPGSSECRSGSRTPGPYYRPCARTHEPPDVHRQVEPCPPFGHGRYRSLAP